jgi:hypothetical protein
MVQIPTKLAGLQRTRDYTRTFDVIPRWLLKLKGSLAPELGRANGAKHARGHVIIFIFGEGGGAERIHLLQS